MQTTQNYTVIGAGHGGKAMAAHLALMGFRVTLFNRTPERVAAIKARRGIDLESYEGGPRGFGRLALVTSDMREALAEAEVVHVVVPSSAHAEVAKAAAPHLCDGQIVVLHPGRTLGAIEFDKMLRDQGCKAEVIVAEAGTFIYASRSDGPAQARIFRIKDAVPLAALPATRTAQVLEALAPAYPQFIDGINVLRTGLDNMGAIFHPALTLLNAGRIESTHGDYEFYIEGVTPSVARVLEALDRERVTVAASLGIHAQTGSGVAEDGLRCRRRRPQRGDPQPAGLLRHQGAQYTEPPLHLRGHSDEPGADRGLGPALWRLGARDGRDHPPGVHHPPHRLLAPRPHPGEAGH